LATRAPSYFSSASVRPGQPLPGSAAEAAGSQAAPRLGAPDPELAPITLGDLVIDPERRRVTVGGRPVSLTATEFDLLAYLAASPGRVYRREQLLTAVWGYEFAGADRTVDVHIRRLREKIEPDPSNPVYILTSWGRGYYASDVPPAGGGGKGRGDRP